MDRIFKSGIVTTIVGLVFLGAALYMYLSESHDAVTAAAVSGIGLLFLRSKDSLIGLGKPEDGE